MVLASGHPNSEQQSHEENDIQKRICVGILKQQAQLAVGIQLVTIQTTTHGYLVARICEHMKEMALKNLYSIF